jgi:hypothetical protein
MSDVHLEDVFVLARCPTVVVHIATAFNFIPRCASLSPSGTFRTASWLRRTCPRRPSCRARSCCRKPPRLGSESGRLSHSSHHDDGALSHLNRGIDGVFEIVRVAGRGLVSIAEVHAIVARAYLAQSEPGRRAMDLAFWSVIACRPHRSPRCCLMSRASSNNQAER